MTKLVVQVWRITASSDYAWPTLHSCGKFTFLEDEEAKEFLKNKFGLTDAEAQARIPRPRDFNPTWCFRGWWAARSGLRAAYTNLKETKEEVSLVVQRFPVDSPVPIELRHP